MKLISWNVNGLRAVHKKGFLTWLLAEKPDICCLQETKAHLEQLPEELKQIDGYHPFFSSAERKGYSGVALYSRVKPGRISYGMGIERFDREGRLIQADYKNFTLFNVYFPNGGMSEERLRYKLEFYDAFLEYALSLKQKNIVVCGDVNTAHTEIDLSRPRENQHISGFLPVERKWIDKFIAAGFTDTFRMFNSEPGNYTWWDYKTSSRDRNVGWRIDYFFVSKAMEKRVKGASILNQVVGSDHCPVGLELKSMSS